MKPPSIRTKIFLTMTTVIVGSVLLGTLTMNRLLDRLLEREIGESLVRARDAYDRFAGIRDELLADKLRSIARVPHLVATLATPDVDAATVAATLETVADVAGSPLVLLADRRGTVIAEAGVALAEPVSLVDRAGVGTVLTGGEHAGVWSWRGSTWRVTAGPVMQGDVVLGMLCLGHPLDAAEAEDLSRVTGQDVLLFDDGELLAWTWQGDGADVMTATEAAFRPSISTEQLARAAAGESVRVGFGSGEHLVTAIPLSLTTDLILARPIDELLGTFRLAERTMLLTGAIVALLGLIVTARISARIGAPIQEVVRASRALARGDLTAAASIEGEDELGILGRSFNDMARRIEALVEEVLEKARDAEQASRAKSDFLATMSHEIRTPMNGVLGFTQLLLDSPLDETQRDWARTVDETGRDLLHIINEILDLSRVEAGRLELELAPFDLRAVIGQAVEPFLPRIREKQLALDTRIAEELPRRVVGDAGRFRQVVRNLVGNATKFTLEGGILIQVEPIEREREGERENEPDDDPDALWLRVAVRDTGIGIPAEALERLFQPFSQVDSSANRRFGGTGLGLVICKRVVELMQGECGVESAAGEGSTFWFTARVRGAREGPRAALPGREDAAFAVSSAPAHLLAASTPTSADLERRSRQRILLVEDNPVNQRMAATFLEKAGWSSDWARNGEEALARMEETAYDLVLMDCQMPVLDGYEATRRIRAREAGSARHVPIVALTANAMTTDRERCAAAGMDDFVAKPASVETLVATLERWLTG